MIRNSRLFSTLEEQKRIEILGNQIWTQGSGTQIRFKDMSESHLLNAARLILRRNNVGSPSSNESITAFLSSARERLAKQTKGLDLLEYWTLTFGSDLKHLVQRPRFDDETYYSLTSSLLVREVYLFGT